MRYGVDYQYLPKGRDRPIDDGTVVDVPVDKNNHAVLPNVGDFVHVDRSMVGGQTFSGKVRSRLFTYIVTETEKMCMVNIVVEETDDDWGKLIKE